MKQTAASSTWMDKLRQSGTVTRSALQRTISGRWRSSGNLQRSASSSNMSGDADKISGRWRQSGSGMLRRSSTSERIDVSNDKLNLSISELNDSQGFELFSSYDHAYSDARLYRPSAENVASYLAPLKRTLSTKEMRRKDPLSQSVGQGLAASQKSNSLGNSIESFSPIMSPRRQRSNTVGTRTELMGQVIVELTNFLTPRSHAISCFAQVRAIKANYLVQTGVLIHRGFKHIFRNYVYLITQILEAVLMSVAMVCMPRRSTESWTA